MANSWPTLQRTLKIDLVECWKVFNLLFVDRFPGCISIILFFLLSSVYGNVFFALWKRTLIPESRKFLPVKSGILGFGIGNTHQGIRNPTDDWNPESKFHRQTLVFHTSKRWFWSGFYNDGVKLGRAILPKVDRHISDRSLCHSWW